MLNIDLGIEFYLFVSHGPRVNFVMREALFEIYT